VTTSAHLLVRDPHGEVRHQLHSDRVSLGCDPGCTIQLLGPGIDAHHALLQREDDHFVLFDLSAGQTTVNGVAVGSAVLRHGDELRIGALRLVFLCEPTAPSTEAPNNSPVADEPSATGADTVERALRRTTTQATSIVLHALVLLALLGVQRDAVEPTHPRVEESFSLTNDLSFAAAQREATPSTTPPAERSSPREGAAPSLADLAQTQGTSPTRGSSSAAPTSAPPSLTELAASPTESTARPTELSTIGLGAGGLDAADVGDSNAGRGGADVALVAGGHAFRERVYALQGTGLDVAVVIDSTSSMQSVLDATRSTLGRIVATLGTLIPEFRLAVVTYRDAHDDYVTKHCGFTRSPWNAVHFLEGIKPEGGGDIPESVLAALQVALQRLEWSPRARRVVLLVGDAPPHDQERAAIRTLVRAASERTTVHCVVTPHGGIGSLRGANPTTVSTFGEIAELGRGTSTLLSDAESLIGLLFASTFGGDQKDAALRALAALENSLAVRSARKTIARNDAQALLSALEKDPPPAHVLRLLLEESSVKWLPVVLRAVESPRTTEAAKAAMIVLTSRILRAEKVRDSTLDLVTSMDPRAGLARLGRLVRELKLQLRRDLPGVSLDLAQTPSSNSSK